MAFRNMKEGFQELSDFPFSWKTKKFLTFQKNRILNEPDKFVGANDK